MHAKVIYALVPNTFIIQWWKWPQMRLTWNKGTLRSLQSKQQFEPQQDLDSLKYNIVYRLHFNKKYIFKKSQRGTPETSIITSINYTPIKKIVKIKQDLDPHHLRLVASLVSGQRPAQNRAGDGQSGRDLTARRTWLFSCQAQCPWVHSLSGPHSPSFPGIYWIRAVLCVMVTTCWKCGYGGWGNEFGILFIVN